KAPQVRVSSSPPYFSRRILRWAQDFGWRLPLLLRCAQRWLTPPKRLKFESRSPPYFSRRILRWAQDFGWRLPLLLRCAQHWLTPPKRLKFESRRPRHTFPVGSFAGLRISAGGSRSCFAALSAGSRRQSASSSSLGPRHTFPVGSFAGLRISAGGSRSCFAAL